MISLGSGSPSPESFPVTNISITLRDGSSVTLGETATAAAMQYSPTTGMPPLTKWISQLQAAEHGWHVGAGARICVTTGSQNALHLALTMLLESGDTVLADEYAYPGMLETVRPMGVDVLGVAGDGLGMDPDSLEAVLQQHASGAARRPRPRVLYTIPTGHNPTGATLPNPRRRRVYQLCQQHDILILEDDAYWFLSLDEPMADAEPLESFLSMDARSGDGRVLRFDHREGNGILRTGLELCVYFVEISRTNLAPFVIGLNRASGRMETFKLSRMTNLHLLTECYEPDPTFDPQAYLSDAWGVIGPGEGVTVTVRFDPDAAYRVLEGGFPQATLIRGDGFVDIEFCAGVDETGLPRELMPFLLSWGARAEVLSPPEVRGAWLAEMRDALSRFDHPVQAAD